MEKVNRKLKSNNDSYLSATTGKSFHPVLVGCLLLGVLHRRVQNLPTSVPCPQTHSKHTIVWPLEKKETRIHFFTAHAFQWPNLFDQEAVDNLLQAPHLLLVKVLPEPRWVQVNPLVVQVIFASLLLHSMTKEHVEVVGVATKQMLQVCPVLKEVVS